MGTRPKTFTFTELETKLGLAGQAGIEPFLSRNVVSPGKTEYRNAGRPRSKRKEQEVLYAIRAAIAAGNTPEQVAAVLDVPVQIVQDYIDEVMP